MHDLFHEITIDPNSTSVHWQSQKSALSSSQHAIADPASTHAAMFIAIDAKLA